MKVIGFASQLQNGKDTSADYLCPKLSGWERGSFAGSLKKLYCETFQVDQDFIEQWKTNPEPPPGFDMSVRKALQFIGDGFRQIKADIWLELAFRDQTKKLVISDVRYINELRRVRSLGGINVLIYRPGFLNDDSNGSEAQIRPALDFFSQMKILNETLGDTGRPFEGPTKDLFSNLTPGDEAAIPESARLVDYFLRNEGSKEELYAKIDQSLLPYVNEYFGE